MQVAPLGLVRRAWSCSALCAHPAKRDMLRVPLYLHTKPWAQREELDEDGVPVEAYDDTPHDGQNRPKVALALRYAVPFWRSECFIVADCVVLLFLLNIFILFCDCSLSVLNELTAACIACLTVA